MTNRHRVSTAEAGCWISVYTELVRGVERALAQARRAATSHASEIALLQTILDDYGDRQAFWRMQRGAQLLHGLARKPQGGVPDGIEREAAGSR